MTDETHEQKCEHIATRYDAHEIREPHPCPFATEIDGKPDYRCTCCETCEDECCDSI